MAYSRKIHKKLLTMVNGKGIRDDVGIKQDFMRYTENLKKADKMPPLKL